MQRKLINGVIAGVMLSLTASGAWAQAKAGPKVNVSGGVVKIGVLTDMSGLYSDIGCQGGIESAKMAIEDYKAQAKPSFNIELVSADHQNKADIGSNKAREWFDTQGVDMITDVLNSAVGLAVAKVAGEKKRILMDTGAASSRLTNEDCNPYTVHYVYDTYALANGTGTAVTKNGGDTWFFLTADYAFGHSLEQDTTNAVKAAGGKVLGAVRVPLNASDF